MFSIQQGGKDHHSPFTFYLLLTTLQLLLPSCFSVPQVKSILHEQPSGMVALQVFADTAKRADHPSSIEPLLMKQIVQGVYLQEEKTTVNAILTGSSRPIRAFTDQEEAFLTPWLIKGLATATPEEHVLFETKTTTEHGNANSTGTIFVDDGILHLTLTRYHNLDSRPQLLSRPSNSFTRPKRWSMKFYPEHALRQQTKSLEVVGQGSNAQTLQISLSALSKHLSSTKTTTSRSHSSGDAHPSTPLNPNPTQEDIDTLHEDVKDLKNSLKKQNATLKRLEERLKETNP